MRLSGGLRGWSLVGIIAGLVLAACSAGTTAPPLGAVEEVCIADFCAGYPAGWEVAELGDTFISFVHPSDSAVVATIGRVNLEGVVANAGGSWPRSARDVVDDLWSLLDGGDAELGTVGLNQDGSLDSWGLIATGRLWHRLIPTSISHGYGVEVRGPNASWEPHADVFRGNLAVINTEL